MSSKDIELSFGGDAGHDELRDFLNVPTENLSDEYRPKAPEMRAENWTALKSVLTLGGRFDGRTFTAPYTWTADVPKDADPFRTYFVMGENVLMRAEGHKNGAIIRRLTHNIVYATDWENNRDYRAIALPDGTKGYVSTQYLRSQIDYRAYFTKKGRTWKMTVFIAGD